MTIPYPAVESARLRALERYRVLDTPPEAVFDRIAELTGLLFDAPISMVGLIDATRHWFKAARGVGTLRQNRREHSFCTYTILGHEILTVPDARQDARFARIPPVADFGIRFYAGAPLTSLDGYQIGSVCIFDLEPRADLKAEDRSVLRYLARVSMSEFEHRLQRVLGHADANPDDQIEASANWGSLLLRQLETVAPSAEHMAALEASAVVRVITPELLTATLQTDHGLELFDWLRGLSFVEAHPDGLYPHDATREALLERLRTHDPDRHAQLFDRARAHYTRRLRETRGLEREHTLFDDLFLHRDRPRVA